MPAIRVRNLEILNSGATLVLTAVECLKPGKKACTADGNGNIGSGNKGKNNFGTKNVGNNNIGNSNRGNANRGNNNEGTGHHCFNMSGSRKNLKATVEFSAASSDSVDITCAVTTVGYVPNFMKWGLYTSALSYLGGDSRVNIVGFTPTGVNCAFLTADGVPLRVVQKAYESTPMTWTITLESSEIVLAPYAQVVAYKQGVGASDALTLKW
ncbi:hypothetical protein APUTEX25_005840 [Auxenochlorella protothecoides]|uniref:Uncharacterized protein n=1 Tax=Auxenochlorella protothecoides TaxID=3075 RepID=A0A3M7L0S3_AUXPR|nr:hypothetical protein APUTEX25_005840 [Auxenochlorella protothecoides]|eukprot:RMZ55799.1 hypothetical protein APUTEX25_005840 [Auxenochlorella protothecoides]